MGSPNYVTLPVCCQHCGQDCANPIQFNYGVQLDRTYSVGESIEWQGPSNCGQPGLKSVVVAGLGYSCPNCQEFPQGTGENAGDYAIMIENDRIANADLNRGRFDFSKTDWIILEE